MTKLFGRAEASRLQHAARRATLAGRLCARPRCGKPNPPGKPGASGVYCCRRCRRVAEREGGARRRGPIADSVRERALEAYLRGDLTVAAIALRAGVCPDTVEKWAKGEGLVSRRATALASKGPGPRTRERKGRLMYLWLRNRNAVCRKLSRQRRPYWRERGVL